MNHLMALGSMYWTCHGVFPVTHTQDTKGSSAMGDTTQGKGVVGKDADKVYNPPPDCGMPEVLVNPEILNRGKMIYGYGRASDADQRQTGPAQEGMIRERIKTLEGTWGGFFCDFDQSGRWIPFIKRPAARLLVYDFLSPGDKIVISAFDRLGRTAMDLPRVCAWLAKNDLELYICNQAGRRFDITGANAALFAHIMAAFAQFECDLRSERQRAAYQSMRARGLRYGGFLHHRYGWKTVPMPAEECPKGSRARWKLIPDEAERIRIRSWWGLEQKGYAIRQLARAANAAGACDADGKPWTLVLKTGEVDAKRVWHAVKYYKKMIHVHGTENWDDFRICVDSRDDDPAMFPERVHRPKKGQISAGGLRVPPEALEDPWFMPLMER